MLVFVATLNMPSVAAAGAPVEKPKLPVGSFVPPDAVFLNVKTSEIPIWPFDGTEESGGEYR